MTLTFSFNCWSGIAIPTVDRGSEKRFRRRWIRDSPTGPTRYECELHAAAEQRSSRRHSFTGTKEGSNVMTTAVVVSFAVIFIAELGDKSQLMAMTFALRYRWWVVIGGITAATGLVHLLSVAIGHAVGTALPTHWIGVAAAVAFLIFGAWTLRGDSLNDAEAGKAARVTGSAFLAVTLAFMLAELGDKTMLATVTLATDHNWVGVWLGSTLGMVAADALAILLGAFLGKHLPERMVRVGAGVLFFVSGAWMLGEAAGLPAVASIMIALAVGAVVTAVAMSISRPKESDIDTALLDDAPFAEAAHTARSNPHH